MIRPLTNADHDDVVDTWHRASRQAHPFLDEEFLAKEQREISERWLPVSETMVYESNGRVVGFVSVVGAEVGGLFVDPDYQSMGIGRSLLDHVRVSRPSLELDVFEANTIGRRFYPWYGFEEVGRSVHEDSGHPQLRLRFENVPRQRECLDQHCDCACE